MNLNITIWFLKINNYFLRFFVFLFFSDLVVRLTGCKLYGLVVVSYQLSVISYQLSVINHQPIPITSNFLS
ncbi:hypothetical protein A6J37_18720 [Elizabethkingia anophelis]|nr:hypothetical protein A6J37_18720 [Elizabethkingia anophelis]RBA34526.1 hypothetical protein DSC50_07460 [Elizabethkingia anophelis]